MTEPQSTSPAAAPRRRGCGKPVLILLLLLLVAGGGFALYVWITLKYDYSEGERAGYVQKFSRKGWICKTWEGELAMSIVPGVTPTIWEFSVRDPAVVPAISRAIGKRVVLHYAEHPGIPTSCFGQTVYFVHSVSVVP